MVTSWGRCGGPRTARAREGGKDCIPLGVNLLASSLLNSRADQAAALHQDVRIGVPQLLEEARGPLDVGEEEGDRPDRQAGHTRGLRTLSDWAAYTRGGSAVLAPAPRG